MFYNVVDYVALIEVASLRFSLAEAVGVALLFLTHFCEDHL